jgi:catechol 2,3-dioxygenase-like lactoylglutathione lyase family enzyme
MSTETAAPTFTIAGFSHVNLEVSDLDRSLAFYRDTLGLEQVWRPENNTNRGARLMVGSAQIHLSEVAKVTERENYFNPHVALLIPFEAFQSTCAAVEANGLEWFREPNSRDERGTTVWAAFIRDPDDHLVELTTM